MIRIAVLLLAHAIGVAAAWLASVAYRLDATRLRAVADEMAFRANLWSIPGVAEAMRRWAGRPPRWLPRAVRRACERAT